MSGIKISLLPNLTTPTLSGLTAVVESGNTYNVTLEDLRNLLVNQEIYITGGTFSDTTLYLTTNTGATIPITGFSNPFIYNRTSTGYTNTIREYESLYNHSNLIVNQDTVFIIEQNAEYFVQGNLTNNDSIIVDGTLKIGGVLYNNGTITGSGIII